MEALFKDFAILNKAVEERLSAALTLVQRDYLGLFAASVDDTEREWKKFESKCPETVARFIAEYKADSKEFVTKTCPQFRDEVFSALTREDIKARFHDLIDMRANVVEALRATAAEDDQQIIKSHINARLLLTDKFWADQKNTDTLAKLANDEEGSKAEYCKIGIH